LSNIQVSPLVENGIRNGTTTIAIGWAFVSDAARTETITTPVALSAPRVLRQADSAVKTLYHFERMLGLCIADSAAKTSNHFERMSRLCIELLAPVKFRAAL
jgi:hypothetical protein